MILRNTRPSAIINCIPNVSETVNFQERGAILLETLFHKVDFSIFRVLVIDPNAIKSYEFRLVSHLSSTVSLYWVVAGSSWEHVVAGWLQELLALSAAAQITVQIETGDASFGQPLNALLLLF